MNNRELATFILLGIGFVAAIVFIKGFRDGVPGLARQLFASKITIPLAIFAGATVGSILLARSVGLWTTQLTGAAILWFLFVGFSWFINLNEAAKDPDFFKRRMIEAVSIVAVFEFFVNAQVMPLWAEIPAQLFLLVVVSLNAVAGTKDEYRPAAAFFSGVIALATAGLLIFTIVELVASWSTVDKKLLLNELLMPVWLTATAVMVLYPAALYLGYDSLYRLLKHFNDGNRPPLRVLAGVATGLRGSLVDVGQFRGAPVRAAAQAVNAHQAHEIVRTFKHERAVDRAERQAARQRLVVNTGRTGVDDDGLLLDRREFAETKKALRWLATCHMGWYRRDDRPDAYRADLLEMLQSIDDPKFPTGSPVISKVRKDGSAWYAYRQTPSGHVFGIGAAGPPPDQWLYDGPAPPAGYPTKKGGWIHLMSPDPPEWRDEPNT